MLGNDPRSEKEIFENVYRHSCFLLITFFSKTTKEKRVVGWLGEAHLWFI